MSTPDPKGGPQGLPPVGELSLVTATATAHLPRTTETPSHPIAIAASTPGVSLAGARVPGGPTLPELDALSLTNVVAQLANELFAAPPSASTEAPAWSHPPIAAAPPSGPSSAQVSRGPVPASVVSPADAPASAFHVPLGDVSAGRATEAPAGWNGDSPAFAERTAGRSTEAPAPWNGDSPAFAERTAGSRPAIAAAALSTPPARSGAHATPFNEPLNFDSPLIFESLSRVEDAALRVPLVDADAAPAPAPRTRDDRAPHAPHAFDALDVYEIAPASDPSLRALGRGVFEPNVLKAEFPILAEPVRGKRLVWLDNAATTQKPRAVIDRLSRFYEHENSNIHRAAHTLAAKATDAYEEARETVRRFIHAPSSREIVFVRGTTEGINLVAQSWGRRNIEEGDEILITWLEHHANIVPWQQLCSEKKARLRVAPVDDRGQILLDEYEKLLGPRTKLVSFTQVSNALGTITPAKQMIAMARRHGAIVHLDGAQAVSHMPVDVQDLDCDFFTFSGHKVFGPTGIGALFGRAELLDAMPPWQGGGNMIQDVTFERVTFQPPPARFEAGTGNIADAVGLGAALDWLSRVGIQNVERYEHELLDYGTAQLATVPGLTMIGTAPEKAGVLSFVLDGQKTEEVGGLLDQEGIAVRSGHHCAQPILRRFGVEATVRASLAPYNTCEDIDALVAALHRLQTGHRR